MQTIVLAKRGKHNSRLAEHPKAEAAEPGNLIALSADEWAGDGPELDCSKYLTLASLLNKPPTDNDDAALNARGPAAAPNDGPYVTGTPIPGSADNDYDLVAPNDRRAAIDTRAPEAGGADAPKDLSSDSRPALATKRPGY